MNIYKETFQFDRTYRQKILVALNKNQLKYQYL